MKYLKFLMIIISLCIMSCESELDVLPQQEVDEGRATATADNIEAVLVSAYDFGRGNVDFVAGTYDGNLAMIAVLLGNTDQVQWNGTFANLRDIYFKQMVDDNFTAVSIYGDQYLMMGATNTVLANLDKFTDVDRKNRVEGEAKFIRGLGYFDLVRLFGQQYNAGVVILNRVFQLY